MNPRLPLLILSCLFSAQRSSPAEIPKFTAKPVKVSDVFDRDTRQNYHTTGDVKWSPLTLTVPKESSLSWVKTIDATFRVTFDLWPRNLTAGEASVSRVNFVFGDGWQLAVVVQRVHRDGQLLRQVTVAELQQTAQDAEPTVDELATSPAFSLPGGVERWSFSYRNGVIEVYCDNQVVVSANCQAMLSWCHAITLTQTSGTIELSRLTIDAIEAGYTPEQRAIYDRTLSLRVDAEKALADGNIKQAIESEERRIPLMEEAFGKDYVAIGLVHEWVGNIADSLNRPKDAKHRYQLAADVFGRRLGTEHPYTLRMLVLVGYETALLNDIDKAESIARPAGEAYLRTVGLKGAPGLQVFHRLLHILAEKSVKLLKERQYEDYRHYRQEIYELCKAVRGANDLYTRQVQTMSELSALIVDATPERREQLASIVLDLFNVNELQENGAEGAARELALAMLPRCQTLLGAEHSFTADTLIFVASAEMNVGNFGAALRRLEEAVAIREKSNGENDPQIAVALSDLASSYSIVGRFDEATMHFERADQILQSHNLEREFAYGNLQLEYGRHLIRIGDLENAIPRLVDCLTIYVKGGQASAPHAVRAAERLADISRARGDIKGADMMLDYQRHLLDLRQSKSAISQMDIKLQEARHLLMKGRFDESITKYREIIPQVVELYGRRSRLYETAVEGLLEGYAYKRDRDQVGKVFGELLELSRLRRESLFEVYTPWQQFAQSSSDRPMLNQLMALAVHGYLTDEVAYQHLLSIKGAVTAYQRRGHLAASNPELLDLLTQKQQIGSLLATMIVRPMTNDDAKRVAKLVEERDSLDAEMSRRSANYRAAAEVVTVDRIQALLPEKTAIIDYVEFERHPTWLEQLYSSAPQRQVVAFVFSRDRKVRRFDLGATEIIRRRLFEWYIAIENELKNLGPNFDPQLELETDRLGGELRKLIWDPLQAELEDVDTVIISPDSVLALCPFAALPLENGENYLIEQKALASITSVNLLPDLLRPVKRSEATKALFVGGVDYNWTGTERAAPQSVESKNKPQSISFSVLDHSAQETEALRAAYIKRFPRNVPNALLGHDASEAKVRASIGGATFVHLATHGFSQPLYVLQGQPMDDVTPEQAALEPLLAGVALAGANHATSVDNLSDGILWASEIAMLDLQSTELVTLSACETALGNIVPGEGMQGCQRALTIAGARCSLTSLWSVRDKSTRIMMSRFYSNLWGDQKSKAEACRQAMIYMLRENRWSPSTETAIIKPRRCPPIIWSGWVLSGDWR